MHRLPLNLPLSKAEAAPPTSAATCLRLMRPSSGKSAIRVQANTSPTPGMEVSSRYRCASAASVPTISAKCRSSISISAASLLMRRRESRCSIVSSSNLEAFSAATFSALSYGEHLRQPFDRWRARLRRLCRHDGDERGDHTRVERIVLGQNPTGPCELPQLERVDLACRQAGRKQGSHRAAFVPSARFKTDRRDRETAQPLDQFDPTGRVIAYREALLLRQHHDVQTILRHIDSANRLHLHIPFLLMRARAQATVRVWKKRPELQAHWRLGSKKAAGFR